METNLLFDCSNFQLFPCRIRRELLWKQWFWACDIPSVGGCTVSCDIFFLRWVLGVNPTQFMAPQGSVVDPLRPKKKTDALRRSDSCLVARSRILFWFTLDICYISYVINFYLILVPCFCSWVRGLFVRELICGRLCWNSLAHDCHGGKKPPNRSWFGFQWSTETNSASNPEAAQNSQTPHFIGSCFGSANKLGKPQHWATFIIFICAMVKTWECPYWGMVINPCNRDFYIPLHIN